jgi:aspartate racemase
MRKLGLIGDFSWSSTTDYYRGIHQEVIRQTRGTCRANLAMVSLPYGLMEDIGRRAAWGEFLDLVTEMGNKLKAGGADGLMLCANMAHVVADDLANRVGVPLINIVDATAAAIKQRNVDTVGLLGTRYTMEMDFFKERLRKEQITPIVPSEEDRAFVHMTIFDELGRGEVKQESKTRYLEILAQLETQGAKGAILACTEIPLLVKPTDSHLPLFNTTEIHVRAAADFICA